jgi:hypothetical protein
MLYFQDADHHHELLEAEDTKPYIAHPLPTEGNELEQHPVPAIEIQQSSDARLRPLAVRDSTSWTAHRVATGRRKVVESCSILSQVNIR